VPHTVYQTPMYEYAACISEV